MDQKANFVCKSFTSPGGKTEERGKQNLTISVDEKTVDEKLSVKKSFSNLLLVSIKSVLKNLA
jgi:hypothetical protein